MRETIALLAAVSLLAAVAPAALASHDEKASVEACGAYTYNGTSGEDTTGVQVQPFVLIVERDDPDPTEAQNASLALLSDLLDGDAEEDENGSAADPGPDPIDGTGFVHVSVKSEGEEVVGVGSDDTDPNWSTTC